MANGGDVRALWCGFHYVDALGKRIAGQEPLERIRSLVIPPAWKHVRISPTAGSPLQAVGMDTTGRVQYLYNPKFAERQQRKKFAKITRFGAYLPSLRKITNADIALKGYPREKVLAVMMRLINSLYIRLGTDQSARHYKTYGITTLQNKHLTIGRGGKLTFQFVGKSHIQHRRVLVDAELAAVMRGLKELGAKRKLFHYLDEFNKPRVIKPHDVNTYLKAATDPEFSAKDFRTWAGTLMAAVELAKLGPAMDERQLKKNVVRAVARVAANLGNTPAVCRGSYIHPTVLKVYAAGVTLEDFRPTSARPIHLIEADYEPEEKALLKLLNGEKTT